MEKGDIVYGRNLNEKFEIIKKLNAGNFGMVFRVINGDSDFALKIPHESLTATQIKTLQTEADIISKLDHPNIPKIIYFHNGDIYDDLPPYLIMEYAPDGSVKDFIKKKKKNNQFITNDELRDIYLQLLNGTKCFSSEYIHRDIKPENILVFGNIFKISDFGLAKVQREKIRPDTVESFRTLIYCAPEALDDYKKTTLRDIYSLGIVFYMLATFEYPYVDIPYPFDDNVEFPPEPEVKRIIRTEPAKPIEEVNSDIHPVLKSIIMLMISKDPSLRIGSLDEIINILENEYLKQHSDGLEELILAAEDFAVYQQNERINSKLLSGQSKWIDDNLRSGFEHIKKSFIETVNAYNKTRAIIKLEYECVNELELKISIKGQEEKWISIVLNISPVEEPISIELKGINDRYAYLENKIIRAVGVIKSDTGRGFNFISYHTKDEGDPGRWLFYEIRHTKELDQPRLSPIVFEFNEFRIYLERILYHDDYPIEMNSERLTKNYIYKVLKLLLKSD